MSRARKIPTHLRDVTLSKDALEKVLLAARDQSLTVSETADLLANKGFGYTHLYPIRFSPIDRVNYNTPNYVEDDIVVELNKVEFLPEGIDTHKVSSVFRVVRFYKETSLYGGQTYDAVELVNTRTGRTKRGYWATSWIKVEIDE